MDLNAAFAYAVKLLEKIDKTRYYYHNIAHSLDTFEAVDLYAKLENVGSKSLIMLKTAAIFHDTGILINYKFHEKESVAITNAVLPGFGYRPSEIRAVNEMILSTKLPTNPKNKLERLICDADLDYLGREDYFEISERLRQEWTAIHFRKYSIPEWQCFQFQYLQSHKYYSKAARKLRNRGVKLNLTKIISLAGLPVEA
jgi:predicted metal-dependent HD superfamily phosphohydrolase